MQEQQNSFLKLVEEAMRTQNYAHMRPVIEKELLHYDILFALDSAGLLDKLTFQGGTSLRLCYGAPRFSEDLDFVGGLDFTAKGVFDIKSCLEEYLTRQYNLPVTVKEPRDLATQPESRNITVSKWQIQVITHPERKDIPQQKIKIEIANIPAYSREPKQILSNYNFLPDGYKDLIVLMESLDEIFADKIIAFVDCDSHIRYRDIWDMNWLQQQGATLNFEFVNSKMHDYQVHDYIRKLDKMLLELKTIIFSKEFNDLMTRFLPMDVQNRTVANEKYLHVLLENVNKVFKAVRLELQQR
jgi:predicted nucleotidyltransferase component of viral defense system